MNAEPNIPRSKNFPEMSRRDMLRLSGLGFGSLALNCLLNGNTARAANPQAINLRPKAPHFKAQARSVIMLMQNGGPSQMELFEPKPDLEKYHGKQHSLKVEMFQTGSEQNTLMKSVFPFKKYGACGMEMAEIIPHIGGVADDICLVRSMFTEHANHTEALIMFNTGRIFQGKPALGSWISYALGTENQNLPAYIVLRDPAGYNTSGSLTWSSGWLPALYRGTEFSSQGSPILNLKAARPQPAGAQIDDLEYLARLNRLHQRDYPIESELETRIQNYELAARMQLAAGDGAFDRRARRTQVGIEITAGKRLEARLVVHVLTASGKRQQGGEQQGTRAYLEHAIRLNRAPPRWSVAAGSPENRGLRSACIWDRRRTQSGKICP